MTAPTSPDAWPARDEVASIGDRHRLDLTEPHYNGGHRSDEDARLHHHSSVHPSAHREGRAYRQGRAVLRTRRAGHMLRARGQGDVLRGSRHVRWRLRMPLTATATGRIDV